MTYNSRCILLSPINTISNEIYTSTIFEIMNVMRIAKPQKKTIFDSKRVLALRLIVDLFCFIGRDVTLWYDEAYRSTRVVLMKARHEPLTIIFAKYSPNEHLFITLTNFIKNLIASLTYKLI